jgi:hypothetical protein
MGLLLFYAWPEPGDSPLVRGPVAVVVVALMPGGLPGKVVWDGFFTCSVVRAGARSHPPVSSATGQCAAVPGPPAGPSGLWESRPLP